MKDREEMKDRSDDFYRSHIMLLDYLLSDGFEITWRDGDAFRASGFCWLLPDGRMAGVADTLAELPPLVVEYLVGGSDTGANS